ncbi:hypothetical protein HGM15179_015421 [Zosterops borbonicus]|uniref:Uncharacterized protein n=1 Tax=Zosterops borbonicus TaxID=364589 RepID=A0A8K1G4R3_9PASS|nr:hypothetical protein HGM15179_015421 [Zosterops borbonicus]
MMPKPWCSCNTKFPKYTNMDNQISTAKLLLAFLRFHCQTPGNQDIKGGYCHKIQPKPFLTRLQPFPLMVTRENNIFTSPSKILAKPQCSCDTQFPKYTNMDNQTSTAKLLLAFLIFHCQTPGKQDIKCGEAEHATTPNPSFTATKSGHLMQRYHKIKSRSLVILYRPEQQIKNYTAKCNFPE